MGPTGRSPFLRGGTWTYLSVATPTRELTGLPGRKVRPGLPELFSKVRAKGDGPGLDVVVPVGGLGCHHLSITLSSCPVRHDRVR